MEAYQCSPPSRSFFRLISRNFDPKIVVSEIGPPTEALFFLRWKRFGRVAGTKREEERGGDIAATPATMAGTTRVF